MRLKIEEALEGCFFVTLGGCVVLKNSSKESEFVVCRSGGAFSSTVMIQLRVGEGDPVGQLWVIEARVA
jgi:hypothetical protein